MIDWRHVLQLRSEMGEGFDDLMAVFLDEMDEGLRTLSRAHSHGEQALGEQADGFHFLKGAALNMGMTDFAQRCSDAEHRARSGLTPGVTPDALRAEFETARDSLIAGLAERAG